MTLISSPWAEVSLETAPLKIIDGDRGTNYPKQTDFSDSGYCLFLNTGNVTSSGFNFSNCNFISQEKDAALRKGRLQKHDVVLTTRGTVGNTAWVDEAVPYAVMRINSGMVILRPDTEKVLPDYIYFFLRSPKFQDQVNALRSGSAQPQLPIQVLKNIKLPLPPIAEQRRIAAILDRADAVRRKRQEAIALTEKLLRSAFRELGGQPIKTKPPEDRNLPSGWSWVPLTKVAKLESGHTPSRKNPEYWNGNVQWLSLKDIKNLEGMFIEETVDHPTELGIANSSARMLPKGTVALCRTASVGKVVILGKEMATSQDFVDWVCSPQLLPEFLYTVFLCSGSEFDKEKQGTTHKTIYMPTVQRFHICLPPLSEQHRIANLARWGVNNYKKLQAVADESNNLFNSLLQRAFRGEL